MNRRTICGASFILVLAANAPVLSAPDFEEHARRAVRASWENARSWAHYLVVRDALDAIGQSFARIEASTISQEEAAVIVKSLDDVIAQLDTTGNDDLGDVDALRRSIQSSLESYRQSIQDSFAMSWAVVETNYRAQSLVETLSVGISEFQTVCGEGRSHVSARVDVPPFKVPMAGMSLLLAPSLDSGVSASIDFSSGELTDWQRAKPFLKQSASLYLMAKSANAQATTAAMGKAGSAGGPAVGLMVVAVFAVVDMVISSHEAARLQEKAAKAEQHIHENRAKGKDIASLYRDYCEAVTPHLDMFLDFLSNQDELSDRLSYAKSEAFVKQRDEWILQQASRQLASCRLRLLSQYHEEVCDSADTPISPAKRVEEPICSERKKLQDAATRLQCPIVEVSQDSHCRVNSQGNVFNPVLSDNSECQIVIGDYECQEQHLADLVAVGKPTAEADCITREERQAVEKEKRTQLEKAHFDRCMVGKSGDEAERKCRSDAKRLAQAEIEATAEERELVRFESNEKERARERELLVEQLARSVEILGYQALAALSQHEAAIQAISRKEDVLEAHRRRFRRSLLRRLDVLFEIIGELALRQELKIDRELHEFRFRMVRLGAKGMRNLVLGQSNDSTVREMMLLHYEAKQFAIQNPSITTANLLKSVDYLIESVE